MSGARFVAWCLDQAEAYERQAVELRALVAKIEHPPEGVRVEFGPPYTVRFVGPPETANAPP